MLKFQMFDQWRDNMLTADHCFHFKLPPTQKYQISIHLALFLWNLTIGDYEIKEINRKKSPQIWLVNCCFGERQSQTNWSQKVRDIHYSRSEYKLMSILSNHQAYLLFTSRMTIMSICCLQTLQVQLYKTSDWSDNTTGMTSKSLNLIFSQIWKRQPPVFLTLFVYFASYVPSTVTIFMSNERYLFSVEMNITEL